MALQTLELTVIGLHCQHCADAVERALAHLSGLDKVTVSYAKKRVTVTYDSQLTRAQDIIAKIKELGFGVEE